MKARRNIFLLLLEFLVSSDICHMYPFPPSSWLSKKIVLWFAQAHTLGLGNLPDGETNVIFIVEKKANKQAHIGVARCISTYARVVHFIISDYNNLKSTKNA